MSDFIPFKNDKTGKLQRYADNLEKLASSFLKTHKNESFVLAIDAPWGRGKTLFLEEWKNNLNEPHKSKIKAVYLNAWKNDYLEDPFMALIATLSNGAIIKQETKDKAKKILKNLPNMAKNLAISFVENKTGIDKAALKDCYKNAEDIVLGDYFDSYLKSSKILPTLKDTIKEDIKDEKLYFFVDELDRCKPLFAIKLLEIIKHIFDIPNTVFILGVHLNELANSIKAVYGSDFNANHYLERFIDIKFSMPFLHKNVINSYCEEYFDDLEGSDLADINHAVCFVKQVFDMETREVIKLVKQVNSSKAMYPKEFKFFISSDTIELYIFFLSMKTKNAKLYSDVFNSRYCFEEKQPQGSYLTVDPFTAHSELKSILNTNNWTRLNQNNLILEEASLREVNAKIATKLQFVFYDGESLIRWMNSSSGIENLNIGAYFDFQGRLRQQIEFLDRLS